MNSRSFMLADIGCKVLRADGRYQAINTLVPGDKVVSMYGRPTRVRRVVEEANRTNMSAHLLLRHDSWAHTTAVSEHQEVLLWDNVTKKPLWVMADHFHTDQNHMVLLPPYIKWELPPIPEGMTPHQAYANGYILGAFMVSGAINTKTLRFRADASKAVMLQDLMKYMADIFAIEGVASCDVGNRFMGIDFLVTESMFRFFATMITRDGCSHLPASLMYDDDDFVSGVNHAITHLSDVNKLDPLVMEALYWTSLSLKKPLVPGQSKRSSMGVSFLSSNGRVHQYIRGPKELYLLDVECPSGTYIMNNMVVRGV
jgi:hypothetical protein